MTKTRCRTQVRHNILAVLAGTALAMASIVFSAATQAASDLIYDPYSTWNGKKIYLSPARHDPDKTGCKDFKENIRALTTAWHATNGSYYREALDRTSAYRNLRARGYRVRIGRGTLVSAIANSNAWVADIHIPIHSNAPGGTFIPETHCPQTDAANRGTLVIYKSFGATGGEGLAGLLRDKFGPAGPGTNDRICHNSESCTPFNCLGELCDTVAKAAYLEREFHTWNTGVDFMNSDYLSTWRIGWAIDSFLGYPRRRPPAVQ